MDNNSSISTGYGAAMPIIGDLLGVWGTSLTNETSKSIAKHNREWQTEENQKQRDWEEKQKLVEREYNTPSAQLQRYKDAGLNPFLVAGSGQIDNGSSQAPSAPPLSNAPNIPNLTVPHFGGFGAAGSLMQSQQLVNAQSANQQAQAMKVYLDAYQKLAEDGNMEAAERVLNLGLSRLGKFNVDDSYYQENARLALEHQRLTNQLNEVNLDIQREFGRDKASSIISKLRAEYDNIAEHTKLYKTLESLNKANERLALAKTDRERSEIQTNIARYKALLAQAARDFSSSEYLSELGLTQSITNRYFDYTTKTKALMLGFEYDEVKAEYDENELVRAFQSSKIAKKTQLWNRNIDSNHNPVFKTIKSVGDVVGELLPLKGLSTPGLPPAKFKRYGHYPNGDKGVKEWYE